MPENGPESPDSPQDTSIPVAMVLGQPYSDAPKDLYIPPDALEVFLETFEGPLDLLLYLIKRQNLDILDIPVAAITAQYMQYIAVMEMMRIELAAEYLVMAAMLAEIKSRLLLPRPEEDTDEDDPRAELIRRLQAYEQFKTAAEDLDNLNRMERDVFDAGAGLPVLENRQPLPDITLEEMLTLLNEHGEVEFLSLFTIEEGRAGCVVSFLAMLELCKESMVEIVQKEPFAPIFLRPASASTTADRVNFSNDSDPDLEYA